jgi:hypothetical protein
MKFLVKPAIVLGIAGALALVSMTAARLLRLMSSAINWRSTAAVESRSSHSAIGNSVSPARLRAKARTDCARGPSLPFMLSGRPSTRPTQRRSSASASSRAESAVKLVRAIVSTPVASRRSASEVATPMVFVPRSRPSSAPRGGRRAAALASAMIGAGMTLFDAVGRRAASLNA